MDDSKTNGSKNDDSVGFNLSPMADGASSSKKGLFNTSVQDENSFKNGNLNGHIVSLSFS